MAHDAQTRTHPADRCPRGSDDKMRQILDGARRVFLADGFDGASMNDIAHVSGVSKGTLYVYFQSKDSLFEALIFDDKRRQVEQLYQCDDTDQDLHEALTLLGRSILTAMCSSERLAHMRMVIGAAAKFPKIGRAFFEAGPAYGVARLSTYLRAQQAAGRFDAEDIELAASQFFHLCQADYFPAALFCTAEPGDKKRIERAVKSAVEVFLRAYKGG